MDNLIVNAALYCVTTAYFLYRYRKLNVYTMLWCGYTVFQLCGPFCVRMNLHLTYDVNLGYKIPLHVLLCQYFFTHLLLLPFKNFDPRKMELRNINSNVFKIIIYLSLALFAFVDVIRFGELVITASTGFGAAYDTAHDGIDPFQYGPIIGKIRAFGSLYCSMFQPFLALYFFQRLAEKKGMVWWNCFALLVTFLPPILTGAAFGSRGSLFFSFLKIVLYYFLFKDAVPLRIKRIIAAAGLCFVGGLVCASAMITSGRVDDGTIVENSVTSNIIRYFGEPPANNYFYYDKVANHPMGIRFYPEFSDGVESKYSNEREKYSYWSRFTKTNIALFKNFWLDCYVEFGMIGSWIYGVLFLWLWRKIVFRYCYKIYIYPLVCYYYSNIAVFGIFGHGFTGSGTHMMFLYMIVLCLFVKKITRS